jgi:protein-tyrosine kinase
MSRLEEALKRAELAKQEAGSPDGGGSSFPEMEAAPQVPPQAWDFDGAVANAEHKIPVARQPEPPSELTSYVFGDVASRKTIIDPDVDSSLVEQYRRLAAALHHAQLQRNVRTVMITSAVASEGKTLTATNLALTLSHSYKRRVLLIDADLRRPAVHDVFGISNASGLCEALGAGQARRLPLARVSMNLWILTAGEATGDPMSALASDEMKMLLADAADHFDWVIVDTPPIAMLSDANLLARMIDGTILVISAASTPFPLVRRAVESIGAERIMGTVLNRIDRAQMVGGYGYYDYYGYSKVDIDRKRPMEAGPEPV